MAQRKILLLASVLLGIAVGIHPATAEKKYDPGASDTEIKIGNIMPYSGPLSAYALIGRTQAAFFKKLNDEGGINGRKINFISYDDAFSPPKTVEQARKLVESDEVLLIFQSLGTPTNNAIQKYLDLKKVPQLLSPPARQNSATRRISRGPWAGSRPTRPRGASTRNTSCRTCRKARSASCIKTTIPAATISRA